MDLEKIVDYAVGQGASDIHITSGKPVYLRIHGKLTPVGEPVANDKVQEMLTGAFDEEQKKIFGQSHQLDFITKTQKGIRLRGNAFLQEGGTGVVFRIIQPKVLPYANLAFPQFVTDKVLKSTGGLILVVGPTGQGKSTTIASILQERGNNFTEHVVTIEDPVEYLLESQKGVIQQREVGRDLENFQDGILASLRQDPDVIMVGEMRDWKTIQAVLTLAETGHLVFSTLHTNNGPQTISRIIDTTPAEQQEQVRAQLASVLTMIVSQRLVPSADGKGRVMAYEVLTNNYAIQNYIRQNKIFQIPNALETDSAGEMVQFEQCLLGLMLQNRISKEMAMEHAQNPEKLEALIRENATG